MNMRQGLALLVCGSLALAACGGDDDDDAKAGDNPLEQADAGGKVSEPPSVPGGSADPGDVPEDACKVVPTELTDKLAPGNHVEGPTNQGAQGYATAHCAWVNDMVTLSLNYTAGAPQEMLELTLEDKTDDGNGEMTKIGGDDASIAKAAGGQLEVDVVHQGVLVSISLLSVANDEMDHKDDVVAMAEAAVGSL